MPRCACACVFSLSWCAGLCVLISLVAGSMSGWAFASTYARARAPSLRRRPAYLPPCDHTFPQMHQLDRHLGKVLRAGRLQLPNVLFIYNTDDNA